MKQKLFIFLALFFLLTLLIGLNAVSYTQKEKIPDTEDNPNRSTFNVGATGTRAFYDLLLETGNKVVRWREPFPYSSKFDETQFTTYVIVGKTRKELQIDELQRITDWVSNGGTLIIIDRFPPDDLITTTGSWKVSTLPSKIFPNGIDPTDQTQMTAETDAVKPAQPTIYTMQVNGVQPSKFASSIIISRLPNEAGFGSSEEINGDTDSPPINSFQQTPPPPSPVEKQNENTEGTGSGNGDKIIKPENEDAFKTPAPTPITPIVTPTPHIKTEEDNDVSETAPVIHLANNKSNLLVDFPLGAGKIIFLSDPYIISNSGIKLVDNAQLGINIVTARQGIIAFDEYHQGYGSNENQLFEYFSGTPVVPIFLQIFLIIGLIFYTQSRRFARALPAVEPNRLSKLEYVSAMAQLQERTKAFDLAIENIYKEFRRRISRLLGVDNHTAKVNDIAEKIAERTTYQKDDITALMSKCEDIMHGEKTSKKEIVELTSRLREVEEALGLRRGKKR